MRRGGITGKPIPCWRWNLWMTESLDSSSRSCHQEINSTSQRTQDVGKEERKIDEFSSDQTDLHNLRRSQDDDLIAESLHLATQC
jgi:hypothetical protein